MPIVFILPKLHVFPQFSRDFIIALALTAYFVNNSHTSRFRHNRLILPFNFLQHRYFSVSLMKTPPKRSYSSVATSTSSRARRGVRHAPPITETRWSPYARLLMAFFASPWGLLIPMTAIALVCLGGFFTELLVWNAPHFWEQFDSLPATEIPQKLESLAQEGALSLPILVAGLQDRREIIHRFCRARLMRLVTQSASRDNAKKNDAQNDTTQMVLYDKLARLLVEIPEESNAQARAASVQLAHGILDQCTARTMNDPHQVARITDSCAAIISRVDSAVPLTPSQQNTDPWRMLADSRGGPPQNYAETPEEMIAATRWQNSLSRGKNHFAAFDELAPETMLAMQEESDSRQAILPANFADSRTMMAQQNIAPPPLKLDAPQQKIASAFIAESAESLAGNLPESSRELRTVKLSPPPRRTSDFSLTPVEETPLGNIAPEKITECSSTQLMRLLHHPSGLIRKQSEEILVSRDRFTSEMMRLAHRLYHPERAIRLELVSQLPGVLGASSLFWWEALAEDPHPDIRYAALSFLATMQDPQIRQRVATRAAADNDPRVVSIGYKLR